MPESFNHFWRIAERLPHALEDIVRETTEDIGDDAAARAPVGRAEENAPAPGTLRDSMRTSYSRRGDTIAGRIEFTAAEREPSDPTHEYPLYVEVGTRDTPAQPFLVPAVQAGRPRWIARLLGLEGRLR